MRASIEKGRMFFALLLAVALVAAGCGAERDPGEDAQRGKLGKADGVQLSGNCKADDGEEFCGWISDGDCWCDDTCAFWGDCCLDAAEVCGVDECTYGDDFTCPEGYSCLTGTPNNCEQIVKPECEEQGGTCVEATHPPDPPLCFEMGMDVGSAECSGGRICCMPKPSCEELGGTCMSDPMDPTFPAICERMDRETLDGTCPAFNQSCCGEPQKIPCGGFAGLPCPAGLVCVDDPSDDCDPNNGGRDCMGMCIEVGGGPCWPTVEPDDEYYGRFEGIAFDNDCETSEDCMAGGCSGEVCAAEPTFTTCEALPRTPYGTCGCLDGQCQWHVCAE